MPLYAILLFGGGVTVNQVGGGLTIDGKEGIVRLKAWPRIGILVNMLRCVSLNGYSRSTANPREVASWTLSYDAVSMRIRCCRRNETITSCKLC